MNVQEYISGGIVESYVLGLASEQERAEFEQYCMQYPELVAARTSFELALEQQCLEYAVAPEASVKDRIMTAIRQETNLNLASPKILAMNNSSKGRGGALRWIAAAAIILLVVTSFFTYSIYQKNQALEARVSTTDSLVDKMKIEHDLMINPNVTVVSMVPTEKAQPSAANIYWDSTSSNVYMIVKNMPKLPSDKQYQLWAMIDGQPKDLGLFDVGQEGKVVLKMKNTQKADAFAITIEKRGNTGGPTVEDMQTLGKTKL